MRRHFKGYQKKGTGLKARKETAYRRVHWDDSISAFGGRIRTGVISTLRHNDAKAFLADCKAIFKRRIGNSLKKVEAVKVNMVFGGEFEIVKADKISNEMKYFTTSNSLIYRDTDLDEWFNNREVEPIIEKLEEFMGKESGWSLKSIINLGVNINKFMPQLGSSYIELPESIKRKKACINVKNEDQACFAWAVVSALKPVKDNPHRVSNYDHYSTILNLKEIQFPMTIRQIPRFEKQNNGSINVYI